MFRQRVIRLLLVFVILLTQSGCWSSKEIEDLSVYTGLALDKGEPKGVEREFEELGGSYFKKNKLTATVQIVPEKYSETLAKMAQHPKLIITIFLRQGILCLRYSAKSQYVRTVRL